MGWSGQLELALLGLIRPGREPEVTFRPFGSLPWVEWLWGQWPFPLWQLQLQVQLE